MLTLLLACSAEPVTGREAWLAQAIVDDNRVWLSRDPAPLAYKYEVMAADPYDFVRGTAGVFLRDLGRAGTGRDPSPFPRTAAGTRIWLTGDPHPENIGTLLPLDGPGPTTPDAPLLLEVVDLDGATTGPWTLDPRRALLGLLVMVADGCAADCRARVSTAWVEGWLAELDARRSGSSTVPVGDLDGRSAIVDGLLADAEEEGADREQLDAVTIPTARGRRLRTSAAPLDGEGLVPLEADERRQLDRLLDAWPAPPGFRVLDTARRYGGGVASLPALRYVVCWDRGDDTERDDELLTFREVVDPTPAPGTTPATTWDDGADRVTSVHAAAWSRRDADPRFAAVRDGVQVFKAQSWSSWNQTFDHATVRRRLSEGQWAESDLVALADLLGRHLASVQARLPDGDDQPALGTLLEEVDGQQAALVEVLTREAERDALTALRDHRLFVRALDRLGPLLGADRMGP